MKTTIKIIKGFIYYDFTFAKIIINRKLAQVRTCGSTLLNYIIKKA